MRELAQQIAKGQKELDNAAINGMIEANMDKAHKLLLAGYDKKKAYDLFFNILMKNAKLTKLVMDEASARLNGQKEWSMSDYIK